MREQELKVVLEGRVSCKSVLHILLDSWAHHPETFSVVETGIRGDVKKAFKAWINTAALQVKYYMARDCVRVCDHGVRMGCFSIALRFWLTAGEGGTGRCARRDPSLLAVRNCGQTSLAAYEGLWYRLDVAAGQRPPSPSSRIDSPSKRYRFIYPSSLSPCPSHASHLHPHLSPSPLRAQTFRQVLAATPPSQLD